MPKVKISEYSATANSNTDVASINIDEGCAPSGINNAIRAVMGHLKDFQQGTNGDPFNGPVNGTLGATTANTAVVTTLNSTDATDASSTTAAAMKTAGGLGVAKKLFVGLDSNIYGLTVGRGAGAVSTNTAVGASTLAAVTSGGSLVAVGSNAGKALTTGSDSVAVGANALQFATTGTANVGVGQASLYQTTTGNYNSALGTGALQNNTTASNNTAVGYQAGYSGTTGGATAGQNVFIGYQAGYNTNHSRHTIVGWGAGNGVTTGDRITAFGHTAGSLCTGSFNTFIGGSAGRDQTSGTGNSYLGESAGYLMTTGSANTILGGYSGNQGGLDIRTASNYIVLSDGDGNPRGYFGGPGSIGNGCFIKTGTSSTSRILPATDNVGYVGENSYRWQAIYAVNGTIQTSDGREKNTIADSNLGLSFIQSLRPVSYKWNVGENVVTYDEEKNPIVTPRAGVRSHYGFIAQEVKAVIPEGVDFGGFVQEPDDGMMSLRYHEFIGPLVKAIQELKAEVDSLKAQINGA